MLDRFEQFSSVVSGINRYIQKLERDEMEKYLDSLNWDECNDNGYVLAKYILLNEYEKAAEYMDKVDLQIWNLGYQVWPLCLGLVKSDIFKEKYKEIYGVEFEKRIIEGTLSEAEIEELINSRRKND